MKCRYGVCQYIGFKDFLKKVNLIYFDFVIIVKLDKLDIYLMKVLWSDS